MGCRILEKAGPLNTNFQNCQTDKKGNLGGGPVRPPPLGSTGNRSMQCLSCGNYIASIGGSRCDIIIIKVLIQKGQIHLAHKPSLASA